MKASEPEREDGFLAELPDLATAGAGLCAALAADNLATPPLRPAARGQLLDQLRPYDRFARFESAVAELLQISQPEAAAALQRIDDASAWQPQLPGVAYLPVVSGPDAGLFLSGFLRVDAGLVLPEHEHLGEEVTYVLQGGFEESISGKLFLPGEPATMQAGTRHSFRVPADGPHLVGLVAIKGGVRFVQP
jgi:anti-sigma factor ChrR (cupin superfamily)